MSESQSHTVKFEELDDAIIQLDDGRAVKLSLGYAHGGEARFSVQGDAVVDVQHKSNCFRPTHSHQIEGTDE